MPTAQALQAHIEVLDLVHARDPARRVGEFGEEGRSIGTERVDAAGAHLGVGALAAEGGDLHVAAAGDADGDLPVTHARKEALVQVSVGGQAVPPDIEGHGDLADRESDASAHGGPAAVASHD